MAVGHVSDRNPRRRISPGDLPTGAAVTERQRRIGMSKATEVAFVIPRHDDPERAVDRNARHLVDVVTASDLAREFERRVLPNGLTPDAAAVQESLIEECDRGRTHHRAPPGTPTARISGSLKLKIASSVTSVTGGSRNPEASIVFARHRIARVHQRRDTIVLLRGKPT